MFVGHTALALAAKRRAPGLSLGVLMAAATGIDLLWPVLLLLGVERVRVDPGNTAFTALAFDAYPWSHGLVPVLVWSALAGLVVRAVTGRGADAVLVGALVTSHWVLDAFTHRPDLPLWPGRSPMIGFGLWNSVPMTILVEGLLFALGITIYVRATRPKDRRGIWALWSLLFLSTAIWLAGPFSPPPPSARAVAIGALAAWLLPVWAWWADRHRAPRSVA